MKEKKQWQKPALIVLVRRRPEEAVMIGCKTMEEASEDMDCLEGLCHSEEVS